MRKRIWIPCIVGLIVCLFLVLKLPQQQLDMHSGSRETSTYQSSQAEHPTIVKPHQTTNVSNIPRMLVLPPTATPLAKAIAKTNPYAGMVLALWQAPIEFYGKVVDENSNAVVGAQVSFHWMEIPANDGSRSSNVESGSDGLFSLRGAMGPSLTVSVNKNGYYTSRSTPDGFSYSLENDTFHPDPQNPVIYYLRQKGKGESLITASFPTVMGQIAQLKHDGTQVELDLFKGAQVPAGNGQLKLEFWREITNRNANIFDWKCQLTIPGGGLVETPEEFAFQAPEGGYQTSIVIDMPATNQNWKGEIRSKYYIQLPVGKYGQIDFYLLPYNGVFTVQSAINPSGSRNLEPAN
jgi:hypothetical protein